MCIQTGKTLDDENRIRQDTREMYVKSEAEMLEIFPEVPDAVARTEEVAKRQLKDVMVTQTGCIGICRLEPVVEIYEPGKEKVTYVKMTAEKAQRVVNEHLVNGQVVTEYTIGAAQ